MCVCRTPFAFKDQTGRSSTESGLMPAPMFGKNDQSMLYHFGVRLIENSSNLRIHESSNAVVNVKLCILDFCSLTMH